MDIGRAFSYPFQDPAWVTKIIIGAVMVLIPIIGWLILGGYTLRIMRRVVSGSDVPLPEWTDYGAMFADGVKALIVYIVWAIPFIILTAISNASDNLVFNCLSAVVGLAQTPLLASAIVPVAISGELADGFKFGEIINRVLNNLGPYLIVIVIGIAASIIAGLGIIACGIGILATIAYASFVQSHGWAQAYRLSTGVGTLETAPRF
jgi:hypothetical protein